MCLKHPLRNIQSNSANLSHGRLLEWHATPPLWHSDAVGGVHPINIRAHKVTGVAEAITAAGASLLYLPAYSPGLNPIEQAFAKIKAMLRAKAIRTVDALWQELGSIVGCFLQRNGQLPAALGLLPVSVRVL
ncbi:MAG: transposase [Acetobacteraceae bacterium]|nr:transposase [Acetobacteraceae bacterium]